MSTLLSRTRAEGTLMYKQGNHGLTGQAPVESRFLLPAQPFALQSPPKRQGSPVYKETRSWRRLDLSDICWLPRNLDPDPPCAPHRGQHQQAHAGQSQPILTPPLLGPRDPGN